MEELDRLEDIIMPQLIDILDRFDGDVVNHEISLIAIGNC